MSDWHLVWLSNVVFEFSWFKIGIRGGGWGGFTWENLHRCEFHTGVTCSRLHVCTFFVVPWPKRKRHLGLTKVTHALPVPVYRQTDFTRPPNEWSLRVYMILLRNFVPEWNSRSGTTTGVNSRRCDSRRHDINFVVVSCKQIQSHER